MLCDSVLYKLIFENDIDAVLSCSVINANYYSTWTCERASVVWNVSSLTRQLFTQLCFVVYLITCCITVMVQIRTDVP